MRTETHTDNGRVDARANNPGGDITLHASPNTDRAYTVLTPVVEGDETAQERIEQATIRSEMHRFTVRLPDMPTTVINGGGTTVIRNGGATVVQSAGTVTGEMVGIQVGGNGNIVSGGNISGAVNFASGGGTTVMQAPSGAVHVALYVPAGSSLTARSTGGDITTSGEIASVDADTSGGTITIDHATGETELNTSGGDIRLGTMHGRVDARTSGGDVRATDVRYGGSLRTSGGDVRAHVTGPNKVSARTSGGNIRLDTSGDATEQNLTWRTSGGRAVVNGTKRDPRSTDF